MELIGYCNGAPKKNECAKVHTSRYETIKLPVKKNGFIATGKYPDGKFLWVIDLDAKGMIDYMVYNLFLSYNNQTYTVMSGSGGLHFYFWVKDEHPPQKQWVEHKLTDRVKGFGIKGIDTRGQGGKIFAPGSKFDSHHHSYRIVKDVGIRVVTGKDVLNILQKLILPEYLSTNVAKRSIISKPTSTQIPTTKKIIVAPIRKMFLKILTGEFQIEHLTQTTTNVAEFIYWAALWRECISNGMEINEVCNYLQASQPEYNHETTMAQLKCLKNINLSPSRKLYYKLFPETATDVIEELIDEVIGLKGTVRRLEAVNTQIIDQFNTIQNRYRRK